MYGSLNTENRKLYAVLELDMLKVQSGILSLSDIFGGGKT